MRLTATGLLMNGVPTGSSEVDSEAFHDQTWPLLRMLVVVPLAPRPLLTRMVPRMVLLARCQHAEFPLIDASLSSAVDADSLMGQNTPEDGRMRSHPPDNEDDLRTQEGLEKALWAVDAPNVLLMGFNPMHRWLCLEHPQCEAGGGHQGKDPEGIGLPSGSFGTTSRRLLKPQ